jgi:hypothetical protein
MGHVIVKVAYVFTGPGGDQLLSRVIGEAMDSGDKAVPKAMSVAYRIALLQVLNLPTTEPDPDSESFERSSWEGQSRETRHKKVAELPAKIAINEDFFESAKKAKNVTELREVYKRAGATGSLQNEKPDPASGELLTVEKFLLQRGDELNFRKSGNGAASVGSASGAPE